MHTRTSRAVTGALAALLLALAPTLAAPVAAHAAPVVATVSNVTVTSANNSVWNTMTTSLDWCVPDGSQPGDTFTIGLPDLLGTWPSSFPLVAADGTTMATGAINPGPPSIATITLGDAVAGKQNVCGSLTLTSQLRNPRQVAGTTQTLHFELPTGGTDVVVRFDPTGPAAANTNPAKTAWFADADQCRIDGTDCLFYAVTTPAGPSTHEFTIVDTPPAGQEIDCRTLQMSWQDTTGAWVRGLQPDRYTVEACTTSRLQVTVHGLLDGLKAKAQFAVSVAPSGAGDVVYRNTATVTDRTTATSVDVTAGARSNKAAGTIAGDAITVRKDDAAGRAGDLPEQPVVLPDGSTGIVVTATNNSTGPLVDVVVSDVTTRGTGQVTGLSCDFSKAVAGAPTTGTTWAGPWPVGTTFTCTGHLDGVTPEGHQDVATVHGHDANGNPVLARNPYNATRQLVSIGDHVWWDVDRDGQQGVGEPPVAGVVVDLVDATGRVVGTTRTDATGFYRFVSLPPATKYTVRFHAPAGTGFTRSLTGPTATDSNPAANGLAPVTTPATGSNSATTPDDPTIDAGLVRYNLRLAKALATRGPFAPGQVVTYTLTPSNDGPSAALPGWSVTDVPPVGLQVTGMSGRGYTCTVATRTCTSTLPLAAGKGNPITVTARLVATSGTVHNTAYVRPAAGDVTETVPLGTVPGAATDTPRTATDNDAQASLTMAPTTWTYLVQADRYHVVVPGNPAATRANAKLVASLDDDGALFWREDKGTNCQRTKSPTCLWYRTDNAVVTVKVQSVGQPSTAQVLAAYNAVAPAKIGKLSTTARMATVTGDTTVAWILGPGATAAQPWGARHTTWQAYLGHS